MPNWVYSTLSVTGDDKEVKRFKKFAESDEDMLGNKLKDKKGEIKEKDVLAEFKFIPYPEKYAELDRNPKDIPKVNHNDKKRKTEMSETDGFNSGGYEWACSDEGWGSKWGITNATITNEEKGQIDYSFESAWSPVEPIIYKMSQMFPKLNFQAYFEEEGLGFPSYEIELENGVKIREELMTEEDEKRRKDDAEEEAEYEKQKK